jgi:hypothetical protein
MVGALTGLDSINCRAPRRQGRVGIAFFCPAGAGERQYSLDSATSGERCGGGCIWRLPAVSVNNDVWEGFGNTAALR